MPSVTTAAAVPAARTEVERGGAGGAEAAVLGELEGVAHADVGPLGEVHHAHAPFADLAHDPVGADLAPHPRRADPGLEERRQEVVGARVVAEVEQGLNAARAALPNLPDPSAAGDEDEVLREVGEPRLRGAGAQRLLLALMGCPAR